MSDLDLLIVHPGAAHGIYGALGDTLVAVEPPLWARLVAGYCRDRGRSVRIVDAEADRLSPEDVARVVAEAAPRLVCLAVYGHQPSASTQQMHGAGLTARTIKRLRPATQIIMVGGHPSALPERTMREEDVDFVCVGEGPITVHQLLSVSPSDVPAEVRGLVWRDWRGWRGAGGDVPLVRNATAPLIEDLSDLRGDVWDLLPMEKYRAHNWQCFGDLGSRQPYASVYTSLGCPYACSFCCINSPFGERRYRMRSPLDVIAEIKMLYVKYGVKTFKIVDEMFVLNPRHYGAICEGLAELSYASELNIWAYARVDTVRPEKLALLRRAGVRWLALGIESASAYVRDGSQKRLRTDDIERVVRTIQDADICVIGNYIFGLPDDDEQSMRETLEMAISLRTEFANFYSAMSYPGSPLYDEAVREGWTLPSSWRGYSQHNDECRPLDTKKISAKTVLKFRDEAFNTYFRDSDYREFVLRKFGEETLEHVRQMTTYELKRKLLAA